MARRLFALLVVLFVLVALAMGQNPCQSTVNGKNYDLSSLASALTNGQTTAQDTFGQVYTYKVCGNLANMCPWPLDQAPAICQRDNNGNQNDCGSANKASWTSLASGADGFTLTFDGGSDNRATVIEFICDANAGIGALVFNTESPTHTYKFKWTTAYACPTGGGGGGGGKDVCCLYAGPSNCGSDMRTLCQDSSLRCPYVVGAYKLAYNWTLDSCDHCKF